METMCISTGYRAIALRGAVLVAAATAAASHVFAAEADVSKDIPAIQYPVRVGLQRQLLVDEVIIKSMQGLRRTFHGVTKYGNNPLMAPDRHWEAQARSILPLTVLRDPHSEMLRVWYAAWGKHVGKPTYMCVADSADGLRWHRPTLGLVEFNGSKDNWSEIAFMLAADAQDKPGDQLYSMAITRYETLYVGLLKVYHTDSDRCDIQAAFSRNAKHWQRPARTAFVPNSPHKRDWDYGNLDPAGDPIRMGDRLWFFYSGRSTLHNQKPNDGAMGVAMLRVDGFASVGGRAQTGTLTIRPLRLEGKSLFVNADARDGTLRVEALPGEAGAQRAAVALLEKENCLPITADGIRQEIQ